MSSPFCKSVLQLALCVCLFFHAEFVRAQSITLGGDDKQIFEVLRANGYSNPRITKRDLTIIRTEACKGTEKFQVKVSILGRITSVRKIGTCEASPAAPGSRFTSAEAVRALQRDGYTNVEARRNGSRIVAIGCRNSNRYQLTFARTGQLTNRIIMGRCTNPGLSQRQMTDLLRDRGYRRIEVINKQPPNYVAEACREAARVRLGLNAQGAIRSERIIGKCQQPIDPANIVKILEQQGFTRVVVIERRRPPYIARGCRRSDRFEVEINRYGSVRNQKRIGSCAAAINPANLATMLGKQGYNRIRVLRGSRAPYLVEACRERDLLELTIDRFGKIDSENRVGRCATPVTRQILQAKFAELGYLNVRLRKTTSGWTARACRDDTELTIRVDGFGEVISERDSGVCEANSSLDIIKTLERRGAQQTELFVEGCYRNRKYRWSYDRLGNRTSRSIIGDC